MNEPSRFGSSDEGHFNAAYRGRLLLMMIVMALFASVILFFVGGVVAFLFGHFLKGIAAFVLSGASFALWIVVHNWALTNPK